MHTADSHETDQIDELDPGVRRGDEREKPSRGEFFTSSQSQFAARIGVAADEGQQSAVSDPSGHAGHQDVVIDVVEELRQVEIDRDAITGLDVGLYLLERAVGGTFRSEAMTRLGEFGIE